MAVNTDEKKERIDNPEEGKQPEAESNSVSLWEKIKESLIKAAEWLKEHLPDGVANFVYGTASIVGRTFRTLAFGTVEGVGQQFKDTLAAEELKKKAQAHEHESRAQANEKGPDKTKEKDDQRDAPSGKEANSEATAESMADRYFKSRKYDVKEEKDGTLQVSGTAKDGKPMSFQVGNFVHQIDDWQKLKEAMGAARYLSYSGYVLQDIADGQAIIQNYKGQTFSFNESRLANDLKSVVSEIRLSEREAEINSPDHESVPDAKESSNAPAAEGERVHINNDDVEIVVQATPLEQEVKEYLDNLSNAFEKSGMETVAVDREQMTFSVRQEGGPVYVFPIQMGMNEPEKVIGMYEVMEAAKRENGSSYSDMLQEYARHINDEELQETFHSAGFHLYANEARGSEEVYVFPYEDHGVSGQIKENAWIISSAELLQNHSSELSAALFSAGVYVSGYEIEDDKVIGLTNCQVESAVTSLEAIRRINQSSDLVQHITDYEVPIATEQGDEVVTMKEDQDIYGNVSHIIGFRDEEYEVEQTNDKADLSSSQEELADSLPLYPERSLSDLDQLIVLQADPLVTQMVSMTLTGDEEQQEVPPPEPEELPDVEYDEANENPISRGEKTEPVLDDDLIL